MLRFVSAAVALCAAAFLFVANQHRRRKDPRLPSQGAVGGAILILMASTMVALARPSPYPGVTQFNGDRYGSAQLGPEVARSIGCPPPCVRGRARKRPPVRTQGRPAAWCGWWLGQHLGMPLRELWLARNWAKVGTNAGGPAPGVIVVWRHHVGIITGHSSKGWIVKSGNDGRAVRERPRSVAGAIAFRRIS